jgi:hypothetical protein
MRGAIFPLPQHAFMALCLVKHRDNFTFLPFADPDYVKSATYKSETKFRPAAMFLTFQCVKMLQTYDQHNHKSTEKGWNMKVQTQ